MKQKKGEKRSEGPSTDRGHSPIKMDGRRRRRRRRWCLSLKCFFSSSSSSYNLVLVLVKGNSSSRRNYKINYSIQAVFLTRNGCDIVVARSLFAAAAVNGSACRKRRRQETVNQKVLFSFNHYKKGVIFHAWRDREREPNNNNKKRGKRVYNVDLSAKKEDIYLLCVCIHSTRRFISIQ